MIAIMLYIPTLHIAYVGFFIDIKTILSNLNSEGGFNK